MEICQSCGMPLTEDKIKGTEIDDSLNEEYCIYCYKDGDFTNIDISLEDQIIKFSKLAYKLGITSEEAKEMAERLLPTLKRWKKE